MLRPSRLGSAGRSRTAAQLLVHLPPPVSPGPRLLLRALARLLTWLGHPESLSDLAALSGEAFRCPSGCPLLPDPEPDPLHLAEALAALGYSQARLAAPGPPAAAVREVAAAETAQGRPLLLADWAPHPQGLSLIAGVTPEGLLCGPAPGAQPEEAYLAAPAPDRPALLVTLGPRGEPPGELLTPLTAAAQRAWQEPPGAARIWETWLHRLQLGAASGDASALGRELTRLVEARSLAAECLQRRAAGLEPLPAAWLLHAAEACDRLVELLEPPAAQWAEAPRSWPGEDPAPCERLAEAVGQAAELDRQALAALRLAAEADYPPEAEDDA